MKTYVRKAYSEDERRGIVDERHEESEVRILNLAFTLRSWGWGFTYFTVKGEDPEVPL